MIEFFFGFIAGCACFLLGWLCGVWDTETRASRKQTIAEELLKSLLESKNDKDAK